MDLSLKRFEIFIVFLVALFILTAVGVFLFLPGGDATVRSILLLPQPVVINEKQALLDHVSAGSSAPKETEEERLEVLAELQAVASTTKPPPEDERLKVLEELSRTQ